LPTGFLRGAAAASGIALINSFGNLAGFVSPYLVGWLNETTHNSHAGLFVLSGFLLAGAVLTLTTPKAELLTA
jgi:MFS-type transporter involved in bile tolerance (Atg22 family)